ncbi:3-demethoxyubiquinol 3-hydroxylase [Citrobacter sp. JGM124]|uniref:3-demethoxyubiquinol 3-hydroxylase n=1 Tax=Citrobacter sp. JGM124 TaxID=2799789 RepID=UPI001BA61EDF|nr:3-demethoxyubiquinol 3-hydroxylase [Citrobacter sp. JGM124]MBS0848614.1 2-octaprenyl-3-methyl-6-methoxy-1,4-benzoquinol hydroxylase [Citrobacter sp. JGM124]
MKDQPIEVAVVGGGMVGAAAALGLANSGFNVAVIEHQAPAAFQPDSPPDVRISALGVQSVALLQSLGIWQHVLLMRAHPYRRLETWEWERAHVSFDANELGISELGYMVENRVLQSALWQALENHPKVTLFCPAQLSQIYRTDPGWRLHFAKGEILDVPMVVGADGANSQIRQWAGIGIHAWQYHQSCMLITVECDDAPGDSTWQHFTPTGPHAFLPLYENWASLVWYDEPARIRQLQGMNMAQLQKSITSHFPSRLGAVRPVASGAFPLTRRHALSYVKPGLALVGDAAHTIHPLAGQGVNLGYRDVQALLNVMTRARSEGEQWAGLDVLRRYQSQRRGDNLLMQTGMDFFYAGFGNDLPPVRALRNLGLMAAQRAGKLKQQALKYALGL